MRNVHGDPGKRLFIHEQTIVFRSRSIEMLVQKSFSMNSWAVGSRAGRQQSTIFLVAHVPCGPFPRGTRNKCNTDRGDYALSCKLKADRNA